MSFSARLQSLDPVIVWVTFGLVVFGLAMLMSQPALLPFSVPEKVYFT